jgi:hypothetical protein
MNKANIYLIIFSLFLLPSLLKADFIPNDELLSEVKMKELNEDQLFRYIEAMGKDMARFEAAFESEQKRTSFSWPSILNIFNQAHAVNGNYCIHNATFKFVGKGCSQSDGYSFKTSESPSVEILSENGLNTSCPASKGQACGIMAGITSTPGLLCSKKGTSFCLKRGKMVNAQKRLAASLVNCFMQDKVNATGKIDLPYSGTNANKTLSCLPLLKSFSIQYLQLKQFCESKDRKRMHRALSKVCQQTFSAAKIIWEEVQSNKNGIPEIKELVCSDPKFRIDTKAACIDTTQNDSQSVDDLVASSKEVFKFTYDCPEEVDSKNKERPFAEEPGYICTQDNPLNFRKGPSTDKQILGKIPRNSKVMIVGPKSSNDYVKVKWKNKVGYAHSGFICPKPVKDPAPKIPSKVEATDFDYIPGSKCDHRSFAGNYSASSLGNRKAFLTECFKTSGVSKKICMDMTCPNTNPGNIKTFRKLYGSKVPYQMVPPSSEYKHGIKLAKIITRFENNGVCVKHVTNWYRTSSYNGRVGGAKSSYHKRDGGGKAVDILLCSRNDQSKARSLAHKWNRGSWPGGLGYYHNSYTLHLDLRNYKARW